ncbi:MAG TPA: glycosyltransferase family 2 protein [Verrucomicrobiae bacterium]|nr:glycosyltransferase family 2 protein [Verrucomicrobiae bacterium]
MTTSSETAVPASKPWASVIVLNYNGAFWLERCLRSLREQTVFHQLEIIVADNDSPDHSAELAKELIAGWSNARVLEHGANLGFCEGNNRAARTAQGKYLFFLNNDAWLEAQCLENLLTTIEKSGAQAGTPLMLNYGDNSVQSGGAGGFDIFGLMSETAPGSVTAEIFMPGGCSYLIERELFERIGGFDSEFYMYADEYDLSWRVWIAGARALFVPAARLHHRGAADVNPAGGETRVEIRTTHSKRFYSNRNGLLLLLKDCEHVLLLLAVFQFLLLIAESLAALILLRDRSFWRRAYWDAFASCWSLRRHIFEQRRYIRGYRKRSDWQMLRFLRLRLNRWGEWQSIRRHGLPKTTAR